MKRMILLCLYDKDGDISNYKKYLIHETMKVCEKLIIVVNGFLKPCERIYLEEKKFEIVMRENEGFDAGAYKYLFNEVLSDKLFIYDEIIMMNDSFYGPLYAWDYVFDVMDNIRTDFWGLTKSLGDLQGINITEHLQGYFIGIRKSIFLNKKFREFWDTLGDIKNYMDAVEKYEIRFTAFFRNLGFSYISFTDLYGADAITNDGSNPYLNYPYELVSEYHCPILKKKSLLIPFSKNALEAISYIKQNMEYDTALIKEEFLKNNNLSYEHGITLMELKEFCEAYKKIYIYGHGRIGKSLGTIMEYLNINYEGYIVTDNSNDDTVQSVGSVNYDKDTGVIIAASLKFQNSMEQEIRKYYDKVNYRCI